MCPSVHGGHSQIVTIETASSEFDPIIPYKGAAGTAAALLLVHRDLETPPQAGGEYYLVIDGLEESLGCLRHDHHLK